MTEGQFKEIKEFCASLAEKRQMLDDRFLLDKCQEYMSGLVGLCEYANAPLEADPEPAP